MEHVQSSVQIYFSNDYARFRMINGNRQLNERKINKIIEEIHNGNDMRRYYPLQVKENGDRLDILDGQHRFFIAKRLKSPVYYILVKEEKSMPDIAKINSNVDKWKDKDFINCYVQHDNENYKILQRLIDQYKLSAGVLIKMLGDGVVLCGGSSIGLKESFQHGTFKVNHLGYTTDLIEHCKQFEFFPLWRDRNFMGAVDRIIKGGLINISDVLEAFKKRPEQLTRQIGVKEYVYNLEQIVNVGKQKRILIAA